MKQYFQDEIIASGPLAPLFNGMLDAQQKIVDRLDIAEMRLISHDERIADIASAFPNVDTEGHRRYHQTMIEILEERRRLRVAILEKTISGLVWAVLVFVGMAAWHYIKTNLGRVS